MISSLFLHYQRNVPKREPKPPSWNFNLALNFLKDEPWEPLKEARFRELTTKTVFLLGFSLGARFCEIHRLSGRVCFGREGVSAVLTYDDQFWLKMENALRQVKRTIVLPGLYDQTDDREELLVCPVRALKYYLKRKAELGGNERFLFVAPKNPARPASKLSLTHMIKRVILESHREANLPGDQMLRVVTGAKARDIRAMASSLRFITSNSWADLEEAALWKSNVVFASHYLRERGDPFYEDGTWRLRPPDTPVVAAQGVVHPLCTTASSEARITAGTTPSGSRREPKDSRSKVKSSKRKTS